MAVSLQHTWESLAGSVGHYLGYGDDPSAFSDDQMSQVERCLDGGYRRACYPVGYSWSWMMATRNIVTTKSDIAEYAIPIEIGNVSGPLTVSTTSSSYGSIRLFHEGVIRQMRSANPSMSGRPCRVAVFNAQPAPGFESGKRALFYPTPDGTYTIEGRCQLKPLPIREETPTPLGGMEFSQMLLEACLAEAERQLDDMQGVHHMAFQEQLQAALEQDKRQRPEFQGQMLDPDCPEATAFMAAGRLYGLSNQFTVNYNGTFY